VSSYLSSDRGDREAEEVVAALGVEALHGLDQADVRDLLEVVGRDAAASEAAGGVGGHAHVEADELVVDRGPVGGACVPTVGEETSGGLGAGLRPSCGGCDLHAVHLPPIVQP
jgi:hypothetical protein